MDGPLVVIPLVALIFPIGLLLAALVFDGLIVAWAIYRFWHDDAAPRIWRWTIRNVRLHPSSGRVAHR
jgi:hypothetical protein